MNGSQHTGIRAEDKTQNFDHSKCSTNGYTSSQFGGRGRGEGGGKPCQQRKKGHRKLKPSSLPTPCQPLAKVRLNQGEVIGIPSVKLDGKELCFPICVLINCVLAKSALLTHDHLTG